LTTDSLPNSLQLTSQCPERPGQQLAHVLVPVAHRLLWAWEDSVS
jgi:hypothetical protein